MDEEVLINDFATQLTAPLLAGAGAGETISVAARVPAFPASAVGKQGRIRFGTQNAPGEIAIVRFTSETTWTIIQRAAEDGGRWGPATYPAGTIVRPQATAESFQTVIATKGVGYPRSDGSTLTPRSLSGVIPATAGDHSGNSLFVPPSGGADDVPAIQAACDKIANSGCAGKVRIGGTYKFATPLMVRPGVQVLGTYGAALSHSQNYLPFWGAGYDLPFTPPNYTAPGTLIEMLHGHGNASATPGINLQGSNSLFGGACLYWPNQVGPSAASPTAYPWAVYVDKGSNAAVLDVELLNCYQGIKVQGGFRATIRGITGDVYYRGLDVNFSKDVLHLSDCLFGPWTSYQSNLGAWVAANSVAYRFGENDLLDVKGAFAYGHAVGCELYVTGAGQQQATYGKMVNCSFDGVGKCFVVDGTQGQGLLVSNGTFIQENANPMVDTGTANFSGAVVGFDNCSFYNSGGYYGRLQGSGLLRFRGCVFQANQNRANGISRGNSAQTGITSSAGLLSVTDSQFLSDQPQINAAAGTNFLVAANNIVSGTVRITNNATRSAVANNIGSS